MVLCCRGVGVGRDAGGRIGPGTAGLRSAGGSGKLGKLLRSDGGPLVGVLLVPGAPVV